MIKPVAKPFATCLSPCVCWSRPSFGASSVALAADSLEAAVATEGRRGGAGSLGALGASTAGRRVRRPHRGARRGAPADGLRVVARVVSFRRIHRIMLYCFHTTTHTPERERESQGREGGPRLRQPTDRCRTRASSAATPQYSARAPTDMWMALTGRATAVAAPALVPGLWAALHAHAATLPTSPAVKLTTDTDRVPAALSTVTDGCGLWSALRGLSLPLVGLRGLRKDVEG